MVKRKKAIETPPMPGATAQPPAAEIHQHTVDWYLAGHPEDGAQRIAEAVALGCITVIDEQMGKETSKRLKKSKSATVIKPPLEMTRADVARVKTMAPPISWMR
ncbi:MAG: hypothetical protein ACYDDV_00440 [Methanoregula sp.]